MSEVSDVSADTVDPKSTDSYRMLRAVVIGLGVLIVIAVVLLVVGLATRLSGHGAGGQSVSASGYTLPPDTRIETLQVANNRLVMQVRDKNGERVLIFNTDDGHLVGQIAPPER